MQRSSKKLEDLFLLLIQSHSALQRLHFSYLSDDFISMNNPIGFYTSRKEIFVLELKGLNKLAFILSMTRLLVFILIFIAGYLFWGNTTLIFSSSGLGLILFLFLVARYANVKNKQYYLQKLIEINSHELNALNGDFSSFSTGAEFISDSHYYNQDIDLFGNGSLFQRLDRTETSNGKRQLAKWLNSNDTTLVTTKQEVLQELAGKADWRQRYKASASMVKTEISSDGVIGWIKNYNLFVPNYFKILPLVFSVLSIAVISIYVLGIIPGVYAMVWFGIGIAISGLYVKRITQLYNSASQMKDTFEQYSKLLNLIETETFESEELKNRQRSIQTEGVKASEILKNISKQIDYLSNRNNMIFAPVSNGFLLWDLHFSYKIEQWLKNFDDSVVHWFETIEFFDASNSMANFAFNTPESIYPQLASDETQCISAKNLAHPLLDPSRAVKNSISIDQKEFFIITGANMAGKSTFLRTVALNLVMANCGLPVAADSFVYSPLKLITSMRTSDSLQNDESYFFSELKRLKFIVEKIKTDAYFIILDEILKGTNSKDKAEGSKKFLQKLVASNSNGLIATHDLSLCDLADTLPQVKNYYFDAEIVENELYFDYTFKKGICQNMNASFLLKKMEII